MTSNLSAIESKIYRMSRSDSFSRDTAVEEIGQARRDKQNNRDQASRPGQDEVVEGIGINGSVPETTG